MRRRSPFRKRRPASQSEGTTRVFLAIRVPLDESGAGAGEVDCGEQSHDSLRRGLLRELLLEFSSMGAAVRAVVPEGIHLTLKFFGDLTTEQIEAASDVTSSVAAAMPTFDFHLFGLGAFPSERRPSVIWAGVADGVECASLVETLEAVLSEAGFPLETRPFQPHVTLARVKARPPERLGELLSEFADADFGAFPVSGIELIASELTPSGPIYSTLAEFKLGVGPSAVEQ
jgi:2'-5' RNA ligase